MYKLFSVMLLGGGIALMIFGVGASTSVTSDISRFFASLSTERAIWMLVGGGLLFLFGLFGLLRGTYSYMRGPPCYNTR